MQGIGISAFHKNSPVDAINNKTSLVYITTVVIHSLVSYLHCYLRTKIVTSLSHAKFVIALQTGKSI